MAQDRQIAGLQYLRGFAALGVLATHAMGMIGLDKYFGQQILPFAYRIGNMGVDIFFVLSGLIITLVALSGTKLTPALSIGDFVTKRVTRILPLMWIAVVSYSTLRFLGRGSFEPASFWTAMTLFPAGRAQPDVIWTLRHEIIFYAVFAISFLWSSRLRWIMPLWVIAPVIYTIAGFPAQPVTIGDQIVWTVASPFNLEFGLGMAIGLLWLKGGRRRRLRLPFSGLSVMAAVTAGVAGVVVTTGQIPVNHTRDFWLIVLAAVPVLVAVQLTTPAGRFDGYGRLLGDASYSIYLFHLHFVSATLMIWSMLAPDTPALVVFAGTMAAGLTGGVAVHRLIERPLIRIVHGRMIAWQQFRLSRAARRSESIRTLEPIALAVERPTTTDAVAPPAMQPGTDQIHARRVG